MIYNDEIERFLSSDAAMESTKRKMETSRSRLDDLDLVSELRDELIGKDSPDSNRIEQICRARAEACMRKVLEEFGDNIMPDPFFTLPMQGQSSEFAQRIIIESNDDFDASIDMIDAYLLNRYKRKSKQDIESRGIPFYGRKTFTFFVRSGGIWLSHWTHDATMMDLKESVCVEDGESAARDGLLVEKEQRQVYMFESAESNAILISIELKRDPFPAHLIFSAKDRTLKFQNPSSELDSRVQLTLSLLSKMNCQSAIPLMKKFLSHPHHYLRWHAMRAILALDALTVVDELHEMAGHDDNEEVRVAAARTLTMISQEEQANAH